MTTAKIKLLSPLVHGSFGPSAGNATLLRRMSVVCAEGMPQIPCLSGNALRGVMRRAIFRDLFARVGLGPGCDRLTGRKWDRLYAALANGGTLTGGEKGVDPERLRALRRDIPPLSLFGSALYTYMLPGHLSVGICWLVCSETSQVVVTGTSIHSAEELVEEVSLVRHVDRDQQDPAETKVTPMPVTYEAMSAGACLESVISFAPHATEVEIGAAAYALDLVKSLGAKSGSGHGRVSIVHGLDVAPYVEWLEGANDEALVSLAESM